jgi:hypothetical protein
LSAVMNSPVSKMEVEQTSAQQEMLPQDIGWVAVQSGAKCLYLNVQRGCE